MKINKSECPIVHFFYVGKERSGYLLDKFTEALRSGTDEYTAIDLYLVELIPEDGCEARKQTNPTLVIKPRDVISITESMNDALTKRLIDTGGIISVESKATPKGEGLEFLVWVNKFFEKVPNEYLYYLRADSKKKYLNYTELYQKYKERD